jgi:hypothetical protein
LASGAASPPTALHCAICATTPLQKLETGVESSLSTPKSPTHDDFVVFGQSHGQ